MGMIDTVRNRIKSVFSRERTNIERATDLSVGAQPVGFDTASIYGRYGIEPLVDYLRIEQELVSRYMDYNEMCVYPELSAALECYADESCQFDILTGRTVWVESDDAFVKHVLQELIDKGLQLDEEIWGLSHELCKYGNCFSELLCTGEGVIGLNALPPETIRRYEKGKGILVGYAQDPRGVFGVTVEDVEKALSGHDPTASGMAYFEPWQILNMRLMGLQRQAPYGHCVAGDTKVWCNLAVKNIVDVKSKDRVYMRHSGQLRSSEVIDRVSNGKKAIYKLKTVHREIRATENHEFLVYFGEKNNRWKQLKDINVGDKIIIATTMPGIGRPPTLGIRYDKLTDDSSVRLTRRGLRAVQMFRGSQKYGQKHDGVLTATRDTGIPEHLLKAFMTGDATVTFKQFKEIFGKIGLEVFEGSYKIYRGERTTKLNLPDFVTPWFCRLWGFMLGDGWISGNQVVFARGVYPKLNRYYAQLFEKIGLKVRLTQNKEQAYVDSQDLVNLLQDLGWKNGAHEKRVPNWIYGLPKKYREEFVAGFMDADGWDSDSDGTKAFHTELCNRELVRGLKTIIDGLGYKCGNIRKRKERSDSSIKGRQVHSGNTFTITFYKSKLEQPFDYDIVKSKEFDGVEEVYDIGVEDPEHNFIADGIVAHNSILESARWLWRRLLLLEDSALLYRLTRSPQKWLFYIDVGKLPPNQALGYLRRIKNEFTKSKFVNERGSLDMRYSPLACLSLDTEIPLLDGRNASLSTLISEHASGKENWTYSLDTETKLVVPGKITRAEVTRKNAQMVEVELDNGQKIRCTPDHRFYRRNGEQVEAQNLKSGDSLAPLYRYTGTGGAKKNKHEYIAHLDRKNHFESTHWMVAKNALGWEKSEGKVIDHRDNNPVNNNPSNFDHLTEEQHIAKHLKFVKYMHTPEAKRKSLATRRLRLLDPEYKKEWQESRRRGVLRMLRKNPERKEKLIADGRESIIRYNKSDAHRAQVTEANIRERRWEKAQKGINRDVQRRAASKALSTTITNLWKDPAFRARKSAQVSATMKAGWKEWCAAYHDWKKYNPEGKRKEFIALFGYPGKKFSYTNHKVVGVRFLEAHEDTGCISVERWHNFAVGAGVFVHNSDENLFLPVVDGKRTTEVELMATPEWQVMDDINYFRDKLFTAIRIPKAYLAAEEVSRSRTLSLEDVRFARSIMRIQRELKNGIKRLCKVHLAAMNVDPEKVNFEVFMTVPSWAYEMAQIEVRSARADFAEKVGDHLSERAILRLVFGFSDEEINALRKERKEEMREAAEAEGGGAEPEKKAPAKTEGSIMDLPRLSRVAAKDEEREDKNMRILKEKMDEMLGQNKDIAESLDQSKDFMKNLKTSIMFQPYRGQQRVVKSLGMGPRRNA